MSLTLIEAMKLAVNNGETKRASVIAMFARTSDLLAAVPFRDIQGNAYAYNREAVLPGIAFRGVNEAYTPSTGVINPLTEALRIAGGDLDVDKFLIDTGGMAVRANHEQLKVKALAASITTTLIKGDSQSNPREFDGLQNRITGSQLIAAGSTSGGDPLSLTKLDELIDAVPGVTHLVLNKQMRRRIQAAARNPSVGGEIGYTMNEFGRRVMTYNGIPLVAAYEDNGGTEPIAFDEVGPGGGTTSTSIYAVAMGDGLTTGLQNGTMQVRDLGELETAPLFRTRVEWYVGLCIEHGRAAGRLWGISNAPVVA